MILKGSKRLLLISASVALLAIGCGGEKKAQEAAQPQQEAAPQAAPGGHPPVDKTQEDITRVSHANIKTQKVVSISDEVKAKWKEVKLEVTDAASNAKDVVTVKVGGDIKLKENMRLKVEALVPDYAISDNRIESRSNEAKNPAVLVELVENGKSVARGWIFRDFPEFNSYNDGRFPMKLVLPAPAAAKK